MASLTASLSSVEISSLNKAAISFGKSNGSRVMAATKKTVTKKKAPSSSAGRPLWFPGAKAPEWLDGSIIGDYGFDPLSLGKPAEYVQIDFDNRDEKLGRIVFGDAIGTIKKSGDEIAATPFQPYSEVFSITRFRENEVIHGRWAMLGVLGALSVEAFTGVTWQDAGKIELEQGSTYFGLPLPFSITALVVIEVLLIGYIEFQRNSILEPEARLYPGGAYFDPLGLAKDPEKAESLKLAELKHSRLAMLAALGFAAQAAATGKGPLDNWTTHLADPLHTTIFDTFSN